LRSGSRGAESQTRRCGNREKTASAHAPFYTMGSAKWIGGLCLSATIRLRQGIDRVGLRAAAPASRRWLLVKMKPAAAGRPPLQGADARATKHTDPNRDTTGCCAAGAKWRGSAD
jgi:hypothetical protein